MLLSLRGVCKRFGGFTALRDVTGEVGGRAVGLLGPNGAGKTTLMKICLGLLAADEGEVRVLGIDVRREPGRARARLGYAAEGPGRIPGLTGLESVAYAAELCGLPRRDAYLRAHEVLDLVGLDEARQRGVEHYSTGMHQRVKLAMALVHDPELVLLDEPTSGLDPSSRDDLLELLEHLRDGDGPAFLLSTHLLHDVERTCDTCLIMDKGQLHFAGSLESLRRGAAEEFEVRALKTAAGRDRLAALRVGLERAGAGISTGRRPETLIVALAPAKIWEVSRALEIPITHLKPRALSLEEVFLRTIKRLDGDMSNEAGGAP